MRRRKLIEVGGAAALTSLAGCTGSSIPILADESNNSSTTSDLDMPTTEEGTITTVEPPESVSFSESWVEGDRYAMSVTIEFADASSVRFVQEAREEGGAREIATVEGGSGETVSTQIAGPKAEVSALKGFTHLVAYHDKFPLNSRIVGSQTERPSPSHLDGIAGSTFPNTDNREVTTRFLSYRLNGREYEPWVQIPNALYNYYAARSRVDPYGAYASDSLDDKYIQGLGDDLRKIAAERDFSRRELVNHTIALVQSMKYTQDKAATGYNEYPKFPVETLYEQGGDCEDTAVLVLSLLRQLGIKCVLFAMPGHMATGVAVDEASGTQVTYRGTDYYYLESTGSGWKVGDLPSSVDPGNITVLPAESHPLLAYTYGTQVSGPTVGVGGFIKNVGDAPAQGVRLHVGVQDQNENTVAQEVAEVGDISPGDRAKYLVKLQPPADETLRLRTVALLNGMHDTDVTEYQSPE